jgi:hypothetical protein
MRAAFNLHSADSKLMAASDETGGSHDCPPRCDEPVEVCWQMQGPSGHAFQCAVVRTKTGLAVRVSGDTHLSLTPVAGLEEGRARAATLKRILLEDGEFEETVAAAGVIPQPGDYIVFMRSDDRHDVLRVDLEGVRQLVQEGGLTRDAAYVIARAGAKAEGGRVLFAHHAKPEITAVVGEHGHPP